MEFESYKYDTARTVFTASCGHLVNPGDSIGVTWRGPHKTCCEDCWGAWVDGVAQADDSFGDVDDHG